MKCSLGCSDGNPAVVMATLQGKPNTPVAGKQSQYFLCGYHHNQIKNGNWANVTIVGIEKLPTPEEEI